MISLNGGKRRIEDQTVNDSFNLTNGAVLELHNTICNGYVIGDGTGSVILSTSNGKTSGVAGMTFREGVTCTMCKISSLPGTVKPTEQAPEVYLGDTLLEPGDWIEIPKIGGYSHHTIYVGDGKFIGNWPDGVKYEDLNKLNNVNASLKYKGGQSAANKAIEEYGKRGTFSEVKYNVITNNCEDFASKCCGKPSLGLTQFETVVAKAGVVAAHAIAQECTKSKSKESDVSYSAGPNNYKASSRGFGFNIGVRF